MIPKPVLNTAPATPAVILTTMKEYLRVDGTSEDVEIAALVSAATKRLEALSDRKFVSQKWDIYYDSFPYRANGGPDAWWDGVRDGAISQLYSTTGILDLPFGPLISVESFSTFDDDNVEYAFDSTNYNLDLAGPFGRIALKIGSVWPQTVLRTINGIKIMGTFGFSSVPQDIQEAIKILTAAMYENRGDEMPKIPGQCSLLIEPYRRFKVAGC